MFYESRNKLHSIKSSKKFVKCEVAEILKASLLHLSLKDKTFAMHPNLFKVQSIDVVEMQKHGIPEYTIKIKGSAHSN